MSRKDDSKAKDAIVTVNIDDFTRTRDSVSGVAPFPPTPLSFTLPAQFCLASPTLRAHPAANTTTH